MVTSVLVGKLAYLPVVSAGSKEPLLEGSDSGVHFYDNHRYRHRHGV